MILPAAVALLSLATVVISSAELGDDYFGPAKVRVSRPEGRGHEEKDAWKEAVDALDRTVHWDASKHRVIKKPSDPARHGVHAQARQKGDEFWYGVDGTDDTDVEIVTYDASHRRIVEKPYYLEEAESVKPFSVSVPSRMAQAAQMKKRDCRVRLRLPNNRIQITEDELFECPLVDRPGTSCDMQRCLAKGGRCRPTVKGCFGAGTPGAFETEACAGCRCPRKNGA